MNRQSTLRRLGAVPVVAMTATALSILLVAAPASAALVLPAPPMQGVKMAVEPAEPHYGHAYVVNDVPADPTHEWYEAGAGSTNSTGFDDYVIRTGAGRYRVWLPGLGAFGAALVTAAVGSPAGTYCNVADVEEITDRDVEGTDVVVTCFGVGGLVLAGVSGTPASGTERDAAFTLTYAYLGLASPGQPSRPDEADAYLRANRPTTAFYVPGLAYQYNSTRAPNTVERISTGNYVVHLPGLGASAGTGATAGVTGYGPGGHHCETGEQSISQSSRLVAVACLGTDGAPSDVPFVLVFVASP